jgi:hypothetical protein
MPNPFWPIRITIHPALLLLLWALATLLAWAIVHVGARDDPPEWDEPDPWAELPQPEPRTWAELGSASYTFMHPRLGVFAPNGPNPDPLSDNLTAADGGPVSLRWRQ